MEIIWTRYLKPAPTCASYRKERKRETPRNPIQTHLRYRCGRVLRWLDRDARLRGCESLEVMKVWITKDALTTGLREVEPGINPYRPFDIPDPMRGMIWELSRCFDKREFKLTRGEAVKKAKLMLSEEKLRLRKELARLELLKFE